MWLRGKLRVADVAEFREDSSSFFGTQITLMQSRQMRSRVLRRLMSDPKPALPRGENPASIPAVLRVTQAPKSAVFILECFSPNADYAKLYLNALMDEFLLYRNEVRAASASDVLASVSDQVYKQEKSLKAEQTKLVEFQRSHNLVQLEEQVRGGGNQLAQLNSQLALLKLELSLLDAAALESNNGLGRSTNTAGAELDPGRLLGLSMTGPGVSAEVVGARQRLQALRIQSEQLGQFLRPKHPKMMRLNEDIAAAEKVIDFLKRQTNEQLATTKEALHIRIGSLEAAVRDLQAKVQEANVHYADYQGIKAGIERQQVLFDQLLTLLRSVDLNSSIDQEGVAILERGGNAVSTQRTALTLLLAGLGAGLFLGAGIIFLIARSDDRCESLDDVEAQFNEEVVAQIPYVRLPRSRKHLALIEMNEGEEVFAESCRGLRSTLLFSPRTGDAPPRAILVTSAVPNEGKSTVALNLAQALAMGGARVLLVDADMRRGRLHEALKAPAQPGLADLGDEANGLTSFVVSTGIQNLSFLPRGRPTSASGELFLTDRFEHLLVELRRAYQYIIVDSVPVLAADDTATLAPMLDGVLFVMRRGETRAQLAREALESLYRRGAVVLGIVFNRVNSASRSYHYYKYPSYYPSAK